MSPSVNVVHPGVDLVTQSAAGPTVLRLHGEHDVCTVPGLSQTIARAIAFDSDLVVDLIDVEFMDVATADVIVRARESLRLRSRSLTLRRPSRCSRRMLTLCGFADAGDPSMA